MVARMRNVLLGMAIVATALFVACSSDDESTPVATEAGGAATAAATEAPNAGTSNDNVCALLTVEDLDSATGLTWGEGVFNESLSSDQQFICDWVTTEGGFATAQVLVQPTDDNFGSNRNSAESVFGLAEAPSITGADETYATEEGSLIGMRIGGEFVQVSYIPPDAGNVLDATTQLAQAVANRK